MPASATDSDDDAIDESREPTTWNEVEDTIDDAEDDMEVLMFSVLGNETETKPIIHDDIPKGKFVDPLGILRMPPRTLLIKPQSIDDEKFNPVEQLASLHTATQFSELVQGMRRLSRKLSSHEADIKQLVRDNFDRFISCKDVIDQLYDLIRENESASGTGTGKVEQTSREVLARAHRVFDPLIARKAETDKIRQSLSVLSRFSFLFTLPSKIAANIRDGEYDKAVQHYKKAASIFQDQAAISHIPVFLHVFAEVENIVTEFRSTLYSALADPNSSFEAQERVIRILVDLARPSDFRFNPEKDAKDDPGWYYLNMAASRMAARLSSNNEQPTPTTPTTPTTPSSPPTPTITVTTPTIPTAPTITLTTPTSAPMLEFPAVGGGGAAAGSGWYRSVRSACGHVARHLPNLWKMGRYYLEGRFDPTNYGDVASDKGREELQAHPQREDKDKLDKSSTVRIFFSDETSYVRVDSRKTCGEIIELCLRRTEGDHSPNNYAVFTWIEKRKKDGTKVIKISELGSGEKISKLHKKWGDKSGNSHKFLFKRKDEKFPKTHDPRTLIEDYTVEMRSANETTKKNKEEGGKSGRKGESDFLQLISSVLAVFSERVEVLFFQENGEDDFDADLGDVQGEQSEEWAFGKMRSQVLDVVTTINILQRVGMTEKYLASVSQLVLKLCGHYVTRVCGQWSAEVALLYLSVPRRSQETPIDASSGMPVTISQLDSISPTSSITDLPSIFISTTKFYLAQFKGIVAKGHPLLGQIQSAFGEALKCFADTLHHLAFNYVDDDDDEENGKKVHRQLRVVGYIVHTQNVVVGNLWSHFCELFKLASSHLVDEEVLGPSLEILRHLGEMTVARYIHDKLTIFNKLLRDGILLAPATEWSTSTPPTLVSEYAMSVLLQFVYVYAELSILDTGTENFREHRFSFGKNEKEHLLDGPPVLVINKLIGVLLWGTMEGFRRCVEQLDSGNVGPGGVAQLRLDFSFIKSILSSFSTEKDTALAQPVFALLDQIEEDAYRIGAGEERLEVNLDSIIDDTAHRSALLFAALTGSTETSAPKSGYDRKPNSASKPGYSPRAAAAPVRKNALLPPDVKFGKDAQKPDLQRNARNNKVPEVDVQKPGLRSGSKEIARERETKEENKEEREGEGKSRFQLLRSSSILKREEKEKEKEKEREQKEKEERERQKQKENAATDIRSSNGIMSSREKDREKRREREREKMERRR